MSTEQLKVELERMVKINNRMTNNEYMQGLLDGRVEMAEFILEIMEEE